MKNENPTSLFSISASGLVTQSPEPELMINMLDDTGFSMKVDFAGREENRRTRRKQYLTKTIWVHLDPRFFLGGVVQMCIQLMQSQPLPHGGYKIKLEGMSKMEVEDLYGICMTEQPE